MNFEQVIEEIQTHTQRLGWTPGDKYEHLVKTYGKRAFSLMTEEQLLDFLSFLRSQPTPELQVKIPAGLFDQIERYLERQASQADGEASRLLMALEDLEIERVTEEDLTKKSEDN